MISDALPKREENTQQDGSFSGDPRRKRCYNLARKGRGHDQAGLHHVQAHRHIHCSSPQQPHVQGVEGRDGESLRGTLAHQARWRHGRIARAAREAPNRHLLRTRRRASRISARYGSKYYSKDGSKLNDG